MHPEVVLRRGRGDVVEGVMGRRGVKGEGGIAKFELRKGSVGWRFIWRFLRCIFNCIWRVVALVSTVTDPKENCAP